MPKFNEPDREALKAGTKAKLELIENAYVEVLSKDATLDESMFALQTSQSALCFAMQNNVRALYESELIDEQSYELLAKATKLTHIGIMKAIALKLASDGVHT